MKSAEECVITHLPNGLAPKMDGAQVGNRYPTSAARAAAMSRRAWGFVAKLVVQT